MKIVELVNTLEVGGVERLVVDLATSFRERGHDVSVVCLRTGGPFAAPLRDAGIEVVTLEKDEGPSLGTVRKLVRYLRRQPVDAIHTHNPLVHHYGLVAGRLAGAAAVVSTIHGIANVAEKPGPKEFLYSVSCRLSDAVVAVCDMAYRTFMAGSVIPHSKLVTINNGIPLKPFLAVEPRADDGRIVFGIVGRLVPVKDHGTLLKAFALVHRTRPECRLEILGDGPLRGALEQQARELGIQEHTVFHGFSSDVAGFTRRLDVSILCSVSEGLPLSVLEVMAAGRPVVGTSVGGMPDLLEGGQCGWLCPPSQPEKLAAAMLAAAGTPVAERLQMGERGRAYARANFSLATMTDQYESLFDRIAQKKQARNRSPRLS